MLTFSVQYARIKEMRSEGEVRGTLPKEFENRMRRLLGEDYDSFAEALTKKPPVRGLRLNTLKCSTEVFKASARLPLKAIPYCEEGYILESEDAVGRLALHHAGIIYMQDPGAMASLCALDIREGARVADLCAAPGGKSGQAAARMGDGGFLLSNEYVPKRARITVGNFERLGIKNAIVTSLDTERIAELYDAFFDVVIADVPCSGEGMFRKNEDARAEWSEGEVKACARRSLKILDSAARITASGGCIVYSTCTFSPEENEEVVAGFLNAHPNFTLAPVRQALAAVTEDGISEYGEEIIKCRRFYPHKCDGEGQFVALLVRENDGKKPRILYKGQEKPLSKDEARIVDAFLEDTLMEKPRAKAYKIGEYVVLISHGVPIPPESVFSAGVLLGQISKGNLTPHHQFFSSYGTLFKRKIELSERDDDLARYLRGEEISCDLMLRGYTALTYLGAPLGGGKASNGRLKNHYPKGLRNF